MKSQIDHPISDTALRGFNLDLCHGRLERSEFLWCNESGSRTKSTLFCRQSVEPLKGSEDGVVVLRTVDPGGDYWTFSVPTDKASILSANHQVENEEPEMIGELRFSACRRYWPRVLSSFISSRSSISPFAKRVTLYVVLLPHSPCRRA